MKTNRASRLHWFLQRLTGAYLAFGMAAHLIILPLGGKVIDFESVASRLRMTGWIIFDLLLLFCCVYHGYIGLWAVIQDYNPKEYLRGFFKYTLIVIGLAIFLLGILLLGPFRE